MTVRDPQMVRDHETFGNRWSKGFKLAIAGLNLHLFRYARMQGFFKENVGYPV